MFVREKRARGHSYLYLVENECEGGRVRQRIIRALGPLCSSGGEVSGVTVSSALITSLAAVGIHTAVMVSVSGSIAILVYDWIGVGFLRRGWINLDWLWTGALGVTGMILFAG